MMQHGAGRARDRDRSELRRGKGGWLQTQGVEDLSKGVRASTIEERKFLNHDGAEGRTPWQREQSAARMRLGRSINSAADYRARGNLGAGGGDISFDDKDLEEIEQEIEDKIQIAIANGEFDNLEGAGKPLPRILGDGDNPFLDQSDRIGFGILQKHGFAPEWIEQQKGIHRDIERIIRNLGDAWTASNFEPTAAWVTQKDRYRKDLAALNKRVRDYNLNCPASAQMAFFEVAEGTRRAKREAEARREEEEKNASKRAAAGTFAKVTLTKPRMTPLKEVFAAQRVARQRQGVPSRSVWSRMADAFRIGSPSQ
eukprot:TRINITY_DN17656_c0_g2_i1.p1 TRINITY_DN17656_c0_g2~~TRINITY_DN17656_c0_g2_i1.p1  ORF type:complete len:312 (+),score=67.71 TRINITY_DN17656_c0_g2_i1:399-1334(+)